MKKRRVSRGTVCKVMVLGVVLGGCGTSNTPDWSILTPAAGTVINYPGHPVNVGVSGECALASATTQVGIVDPGTETVISTTATATSGAAAPHAWGVTVQLLQWPPNQSSQNLADVLVATGNPQPSPTGVSVTDHTSQDIKLKFQIPGY